jgi:hypothetical protein
MLQVTALLSLLGACVSQKELIKKFTPPDVDAFARDYIQLVAHGQLDSAIGFLDPSIPRDQAREVYPTLQAELAPGTFDSINVVGAHWTSTVLGNGSVRKRTTLVYELLAPAGWRLVTIETSDSADRRVVVTFQVNKLDQTLEKANAFTFAGHSFGDFVWFGCAIANVLLSLGTVVIIWRAKAMPKRKRWMALALFGGGKFTLDWATGATTYSIASFQLFGASFTYASAASPVLISFSVPVGALVALQVWRRWRANPTGAAPAGIVDDTGAAGVAPSPPTAPR